MKRANIYRVRRASVGVRKTNIGDRRVSVRVRRVCVRVRRVIIGVRRASIGIKSVRTASILVRKDIIGVRRASIWLKRAKYRVKRARVGVRRTNIGVRRVSVRVRRVSVKVSRVIIGVKWASIGVRRANVRSGGLGSQPERRPEHFTGTLFERNVPASHRNTHYFGVSSRTSTGTPHRNDFSPDCSGDPPEHANTQHAINMPYLQSYNTPRCTAQVPAPLSRDHRSSCACYVDSRQTVLMLLPNQLVT